MQKFIDALKSALSKIVALFASGKAQRALDVVVSLIPDAIAITRFISSVTVNRADDELVRLLESTNLLSWSKQYLALPVPERGTALRKVAISLLSAKAPNQPEHVLAAAVELALVADRADAK
jgi:hypothetical protein